MKRRTHRWAWAALCVGTLAVAAEPGSDEARHDAWRAAHRLGLCDAAVEQANVAAAEGDADAMLQLSDWHFFGTCRKKNDEESARWAQRAAEAGSVRGAVVLGQVYARGLGLPRDAALAEKWLTQAAEAGDAEGMLLLSRELSTDPGKPLNAELSLAWAKRSADQGYPPAFVHLGALYSGAGASTDFQEAERWLHKAIAAGYREPGVWVAHAWACLQLGRYEDVMKDTEQVPKSAPEFKAAQINRAHAMLLNGQVGNARELYAANRTLRGDAEFRRVLAEDFSELRRSGRTHPGMKRIETLFLR